MGGWGRGRGRGGWRRALAEKLRHASLRRSVECTKMRWECSGGRNWKDVLVLFVAAKLKQVEFERDRDPLFSAGSRRRVPRGRSVANAQFRVSGETRVRGLFLAAG